MATESSQDLGEVSETNFLFWGNHAMEMAGTLSLLQQNCSMVDVSLKAGGESIEVHRMVLCASSPYLQEILSTNNDPNPCIILPEVEMKELKTIIEFIYRGEISFLINQLPSLLSVAELLGIQGLNEISSQIPQIEVGESEVVLENEGNEGAESATTTISMPLWESELATEEEAVVEEIVQEKHTEEHEVVSTKQKKRSKKESMPKGEKRYSDAILETALKEMKAGRSLCDTATAYNIPRTTLYMRARSCGILNPMHKLGYSKEQLQLAINAVKEGSSLQQASSMYNVPKTVLWRRVQTFRNDLRIRQQQAYSSADKQAAVQALERGEQLHAVASQFPIPKTTLYREKVRLVEKGILPSDSIKRRKGETDFTRNLRVEQAVKACREGRMSQCAASNLYQIPKTTIWRRLNYPNSKKNNRNVPNTSRGDELMTEEQVDEDQETYEVDSSNIKFVTAEDGEFAASLIILSAVEGEAENTLIVNNEQQAEVVLQEEQESGEDSMHEADEESLHAQEEETLNAETMHTVEISVSTMEKDQK